MADGCQYDHPMVFCQQCGTWLHCRRDGIDLDYRRRPDNQPAAPARSGAASDGVFRTTKTNKSERNG
jgi:hypothetical protein